MATKITFDERFPGLLQEHADFNNLQVAGMDMCDLAAKLGDEAFHFVCGATFVAQQIVPWSARFAALKAAYDNQGLDTVEREP